MTDLDTLILNAAQHTPVSAMKLREMLRDHVQAEARSEGARPSDVMARHLLRLQDAGRIRYLNKPEGWQRVYDAR